MKLLKLIAVLLDYPDDDIWMHGDELRAAVDDPALSSHRRASLSAFIDQLITTDTLEAQENWLNLFDRGRAMSLLLFEHIHGESRDRGQAMVDLLSTYRKSGFDLGVKQLPDYLPVILEYLSLRPVEEVRDWLSHVAHILELLAARAQERSSPYACLFEALVEVTKGRVDLALLRRRVATEERDDTPEAMDKVWEEEAVRFGVEAPGEDCKPSTRLPSGATRIEHTVTP
jgi:nitrate reductase delta subunit